MSVYFGELPPAGNPRRLTDRLREALDELREQPGTWGRIAQYASRAGACHVPSSLIRDGVTGFEFAIRSSSKTNESAVWARYVPVELEIAA